MRMIKVFEGDTGLDVEDKLFEWMDSVTGRDYDDLDIVSVSLSECAAVYPDSSNYTHVTMAVVFTILDV